MGGALAKPVYEAVVLDLIFSVAVLTIAVPCARVLLVMSDNPLREIRHRKHVGTSARV